MEIPKAPIFAGITPEELDRMAENGRIRERRFAKWETIFLRGTLTRCFGLVLEGQVHIQTTDLCGTTSLLSSAGAGQVFAETYALCGEPMMVDAVAAEASRVLLIDLGALLAESQRGETWYSKLMSNLLMVSSRKNLALSERIFCTAAKSIRGRLLTYLSIESARAGHTVLDLPFNRQQLADYLNLDRSALSKELSKMQAEGLLTYHRNHFELLTAEAEDYHP